MITCPKTLPTMRFIGDFWWCFMIRGALALGLAVFQIEKALGSCQPDVAQIPGIGTQIVGRIRHANTQGAARAARVPQQKVSPTFEDVRRIAAENALLAAKPICAR